MSTTENRDLPAAQRRLPRIENPSFVRAVLEKMEAETDCAKKLAAAEARRATEAAVQQALDDLTAKRNAFFDLSTEARSALSSHQVRLGEIEEQVRLRWNGNPWDHLAELNRVQALVERLPRFISDYEASVKKCDDDLAAFKSANGITP